MNSAFRDFNTGQWLLGPLENYSGSVQESSLTPSVTTAFTVWVLFDKFHPRSQSFYQTKGSPRSFGNVEPKNLSIGKEQSRFALRLPFRSAIGRLGSQASSQIP